MLTSSIAPSKTKPASGSRRRVSNAGGVRGEPACRIFVAPGVVSSPCRGILRRGAERAGFEPATHLSARTRVPVALLRPLGHLSVMRSGGGGIRTLDGGIHPHNALAGRRLQPLGHFSAVRAG